MKRHSVCSVDDVVADKMKPVQIGRATVLLTRLASGDIRAVASRCPHQGASLEHGCVTGRTEGTRSNELHLVDPGSVLRCPWHGFEFDLVTGHALVEKAGLKLRAYPVEIENGQVVVVV
jgi:nitrite reductase/ring-hydroxylating ferredoxin subunit